MDMNDTSEQARTGVAKKAYEKPSFRYEQVFVTTALSCGKATQAQCQHVPPLSAS